MMLIINLHPAYRLRMSGFVPQFPLCTFTAWTQTTLPFTLISEGKKVKFWIHHLLVLVCLPLFKFSRIWHNTLYFLSNVFDKGLSNFIQTVIIVRPKKNWCGESDSSDLYIWALIWCLA